MADRVEVVVVEILSWETVAKKGKMEPGIIQAAREERVGYLPLAALVVVDMEQVSLIEDIP